MRINCAHMRARAGSRHKVPTNLSLRADLVRRAKALGINLSEAVDAALEEVIRTQEQDTWLANNRDAIDAYNAGVERRGVFSDDWRRF